MVLTYMGRSPRTRLPVVVGLAIGPDGQGTAAAGRVAEVVVVLLGGRVIASPVGAGRDLIGWKSQCEIKISKKLSKCFVIFSHRANALVIVHHIGGV